MIVVGAGPTGLLLANELVLAGVDTVVVDRLPERSPGSKALNLQPRAAEVLQWRGLLDDVLARGAGRAPGGHFAGLPVTLDYRNWDTRFPYQVYIPQREVEAALTDRLGGRGVTVLRGHEVTALEQDADSVTLGFGNGATLRAKYVVGCDGGRSAVRKLLDAAFPGRDGTQPAAVADVRFEVPPADVLTDLADLPENSVGEALARAMRPRRSGGFAVLAPLGDGLFQMLFSGAEQFAAAQDDPVTEQEVRDVVLDAYGPDPVVAEVVWASRFNDASRQVERYRFDRVLLAGDAAHIHLPAGGQGLSLGLQDAFNLGWKLAAEVNGWAPAGLLDTYHDERHPVGARVIDNTRAQGLLMSPGFGLAPELVEDIASLRTILVELMATPDGNRHLTGMVSGLDIRYQDNAAHPLLGARMPDLEVKTAEREGWLSELTATGRGLLLDLAGRQDLARTVDGWRDRVDHVAATIKDPVALPDGFDAALVRPDGHVCWVDAVGAPEHALRTWFGEPGSAG